MVYRDKGEQIEVSDNNSNMKERWNEEKIDTKMKEKLEIMTS